jgi:hypothetical protein
MELFRTGGLTLGAGLGYKLSGTARSQRSVAVARIKTGKGKLIAPLIVLDTKSCNALNATGGGGVIVHRNGNVPGIIAVDSDGTGAGADIDCTGGKKVITVVNNSHIYAEDSPTTKAAILSFAIPLQDASAYDHSAATTSLTCQPTPGIYTKPLCPQPTAEDSRFGRGPFDERYNCPSACGPGLNYIDQFKRYVGIATPPSSGYVIGPTMPISKEDTCSPSWTTPGSRWIDCLAVSGSKVISLPGGTTTIDGGGTGGTIRIDAKTLSVGNGSTLIVTNRTQLNLNVDVFEVKPGGCLIFNPPDVFITPETIAQTCQASTPLQTPFGYSVSKDMPPVWLRGQLNVGGSFVARQTFIMQPTNSGDLQGQLAVSASSTYRVYWSAPFGTSAVPSDPCIAAPSTPPLTYPSAGCFEDLASWNEWNGNFNNGNTLSAQSSLFVDGTWFVPNTGFTFGGGVDQDQTRAQFVAKRLNLNGTGTLNMVPDSTRETPSRFVTGELIR